MINSENEPVSRIAILNPYLQGNHIDIAETESVNRYKYAAAKLGIELEVFARSESVEGFNPDFVIAITYQEGKLTKYPTYGSLNAPVSMIMDSKRFIRNVLTYDGFLTISPSVKEWLIGLCKLHNKTANIGHAAFSIAKTEFVKCDYSNAVAMYVGTNWDGRRHEALFNYLQNGQYLKCYGPAKSWKNYPESLYQGEIPFDGVSLFHLYQKHAAGLCIGHPVFDNENIASSRTFEIAAASALAICADNLLTKEIYGDSVLYLDKKLSTSDLAKQIEEKVIWIREHADMAHEMAISAHAKFNEKASMEVYLQNIIEMHQKLIIEKGYKSQREKTITFSNADKSDTDQSTVTYIVPAEILTKELYSVLDSINEQSYENIKIIILINQVYVDHSALKDQFPNLKLHFVQYDDHNMTPHVMEHVYEIGSKWVGIINKHDIIFPHHVAQLLKSIEYRQTNLENEPAILSSNYLESSHVLHLPEDLAEEHMVICHNTIRLGQEELTEATPLCSMLFSTTLLKQDSLNMINFYHIDTWDLINRLKSRSELIKVREISCSTNTDHKKLNNIDKKIAEYEHQINGLNAIIQQNNEIIRLYNSSFIGKMIAILKKVKKYIVSKPAYTN